MMNDDDIDGYAIEAADMGHLRQIERALYGDSSALTADARRTLANTLNLVLQRAVPIKQEKSNDAIQ